MFTYVDIYYLLLFFVVFYFLLLFLSLLQLCGKMRFLPHKSSHFNSVCCSSLCLFYASVYDWVNEQVSVCVFVCQPVYDTRQMILTYWFAGWLTDWLVVTEWKKKNNEKYVRLCKLCFTKKCIQQIMKKINKLHKTTTWTKNTIECVADVFENHHIFKELAGTVARIATNIYMKIRTWVIFFYHSSFRL